MLTQHSQQWDLKCS